MEGEDEECCVVGERSFTAEREIWSGFWTLGICEGRTRECVCLCARRKEREREGREEGEVGSKNEENREEEKGYSERRKEGKEGEGQQRRVTGEVGKNMNRPCLSILTGGAVRRNREKT